MYFKLNDGNKIPAIGMGTWQLTDREILLKALESAYEIGYRHIDTASFYGNEHIIGEFLKKHKREEFFITTKLWNTDHNDVLAAANKSLKNLGIDYFDLYVVHWPVNLNGNFDLKKLWPQMESLVELKKAKSIGVSNFGIKNLTALLSICKIKPAVNQIELHPYLPQDEIRDFCKKHCILVISYSSLGSSSGGNNILRDDPTLNEIASSRNITVFQVVLSYLISEGIAVIPRSKSKDHLKTNLDLVEITEQEREKIKSITIRERYVDPKQFGEHRFD